MTNKFIPPHGGYEELLSWRKARIVYDGTVQFFERFLEKRDRTRDQMVQAARSGKQNIIEGKNSREARFVRRAGTKPEASYKTFRDYLETRPPEVVANILICLIHQTNYLLDQQRRQLQESFLKEGGLRERMTRARLLERSRVRQP